MQSGLFRGQTHADSTQQKPNLVFIFAHITVPHCLCPRHCIIIIIKHNDPGR